MKLLTTTVSIIALVITLWIGIYLGRRESNIIRAINVNTQVVNAHAPAIRQLNGQVSSLIGRVEALEKRKR